jgi:hypothetical protein
MWFAANLAAIAYIAQAHRADLAAFWGRNAMAEPPPQPEPRADEIFIESPPLAHPTRAIPTAESAVASHAPDESIDNRPLSPGASDNELLAQPTLATVAAPALAPIQQGDMASTIDERWAGEDIETAASRRAKPEAARWRWLLTAWPTIVLALITINVALIGARAQVVGWAPQTASLYAAIGLPLNWRALRFANVTTQKELENGVQVLVVDGTIVSAATRATPVPRLRFGLRNKAGNEIYSWTALPTGKVLGAGETLAFRSRLATPPPEGRDVVVRFFNRRDVVADIH